MHPRRSFLSLVLAGGILWCLGLVQQVHSEEKAPADKYVPVATLAQLTEAQEVQLKELRTLTAADTPKFKDIQGRANYVAELFNVKQHVAKADVKAAADGCEQALALAKAAKAKDKDGVSKLLDPIAEAIKKTAKPGDSGAAPAGAYKPVSSVKPLMEVQQELFDEIKKGFDNAKEEDLKKMVIDATLLAELSNVNRHQKPDKDDYVKMAGETRDQAMLLAKAAGAKDVDGAKAALKSVKATCAACHDKYQ